MEDAARSRSSRSSRYSGGGSAEPSEAQRQRIKDDIEDLEAESLRIQNMKTNTWSDNTRRYWQDRQRQVERDLERKKKQLMN